LKSKFFVILRILVTVGIFVALFKFIPYQKLIHLYKNSNKSYLFLSFVFFFIGPVIGIFRWKFILDSVGIKSSLLDVTSSLLSGLFFNLFFPSFIAGDVFRGFSISCQHKDKAKIASTIVMDRFSGAMALIFLSLVSFVLGRSRLVRIEVVIPLLVLCAIAMFSSFFIFSRRFFLFSTQVFKKNLKFSQKLTTFHDKLYFFKQNPKVFFKSIIISFWIHLLTAFGFFIASRAFVANTELVDFLILVPIIMAIALIPITIAGAGTREASAIYFLSLVGIDKSIGMSISLLNLLYFLIGGILGGIFYVSIHHRRIQSHLQDS